MDRAAPSYNEYSYLEVVAEACVGSTYSLSCRAGRGVFPYLGCFFCFAPRLAEARLKEEVAGLEEEIKKGMKLYQDYQSDTVLHIASSGLTFIRNLGGRNLSAKGDVDNDRNPCYFHVIPETVIT